MEDRLENQVPASARNAYTTLIETIDTHVSDETQAALRRAAPTVFLRTGLFLGLGIIYAVTIGLPLFSSGEFVVFAVVISVLDEVVSKWHRQLPIYEAVIWMWIAGLLIGGVDAAARYYINFLHLELVFPWITPRHAASLAILATGILIGYQAVMDVDLITPLLTETDQKTTPEPDPTPDPDPNPDPEPERGTQKKDQRGTRHNETTQRSSTRRPAPEPVENPTTPHERRQRFEYLYQNEQ